MILNKMRDGRKETLTINNVSMNQMNKYLKLKTLEMDDRLWPHVL